MSERVSLNTPQRPSWSLQRAVLVYLAGPDMANRETRAYATVHAVSHGKKGLQLEVGVPATREACADIARALGATSTLGGFVPQNLLYLGAQSLIWWRPPGPARIFFDTTKDAAGDQTDDKTGAALIGKRSGVVMHPGLVFAVASGRWFVYAVSDTGRPDPGTALLRAPYFNVWEAGEICSGNVRLPEVLSAHALGTYEKAFFESEFTHPNVRGKEKLTGHFGGPYRFWAGMLKRPHELGFPVETLMPLKITLKTLAQRLEKSGKPLHDDG